MDLNKIKAALEKAGVTFTAGLTEAELENAEAAYKLRFPPDLRAFLSFALPVSGKWPDWRNPQGAAAIQKQLGWPLEGICFDIEHNRFWMDAWGPRPKSLSAAIAVARKKVEQAPRLIPVCGHRYLPDRPGTAGNPVFSVYQTDIIHYGVDLWSYLENEFSSNFGTPEYHLPGEIRRIEFWSQFVAENG